MLGRGVDIKLSFSRIILIRLKNGRDWGGDIEYIKGMTSSVVARDVYLELDCLEQGEYYLYVEIDWHPSTQQFEFAAASYGVQHVEFHQDDRD